MRTRSKDPHRLCAVLLDIDGTLIDSNGAHARGWVDAFAEHGRQIPFEELRALIGMGGERILRRYGIDPESDEGGGLKSRAGEIFRETYLPTIQPFGRVRELLGRMREDGLRLVVATSAGGDLLDGLLSIAGVGDLIDAATSASDVTDSKPAPDIVLAALEKSGCEKERVMMLGDTPYDVEACKRADVPVVALTCGGWDAVALQGAEAIYADPGHLLDEYDRSPLGR